MKLIHFSLFSVAFAGACGGGDDSQSQNDGGNKSDGTTLSDAPSSMDALAESASSDSAAGDSASGGDSAVDAGTYPLWSCLTAYGSALTRDGAYWPFASSAPWNVPMGSGATFEAATDPNTTSFILDWTSNSSYADIASTQWSQPVWIATSSDPTVTLKTNGSGTFATGINCPSAATPALPPVSSGGDANMNIIDPTHAFLDESWQATKATSEWDANYWYKSMLNGTGMNGGVRAGATSTIAGLIRLGEFKSGAIRHALGFAVDRSVQFNSWVWPASSNDVCQKKPCASNSGYKGNLQMGGLMAIPPTVDLCTLKLSAGGLALARAMQDFGIYLVDSSGGISFYAEPAIASDATEKTMLSDAIDDLNNIIMTANSGKGLLRYVTNNSSSNVGGGGSPRAPSAPSL